MMSCHHRRLLGRTFGALPSSVSISAIATWRLDCGEGIEVEIDDGLEGGGGGRVAQGIRQSLAPSGVFRLQGEQLGDGVAPALWSGAPVGGAAVSENGCGLLRPATGATACLAFGVAEWVFPLGRSASWHD
jgi:hypothetical protein